MKWLNLLLIAVAMVCGCDQSGPNASRASSAKKSAQDQRAVLAQTVKKQKDLKARLDWNLKTTVGDYDRVGSRNPNWDRPAREALTLFAEMRSHKRMADELLDKRMLVLLGEAMNAGCDDPMVKYLALRYRDMKRGAALKTLVDPYEQVADQLQRSGYGDVRKFYGCLRAAQMSKEGLQYTNAVSQTCAMNWDQASGLLAAMAKDKTVPFGEISDAIEDLLSVLRVSPPRYRQSFLTIEKDLLRNWSQEAGAYITHAEFYFLYAWEARGSGSANTVTADGWRLFKQRLAIAESDANKAWKLDPTQEQIPSLMIRIELGQGQGRERMEMWFSRAMALNTNNYDACYQKLYYLMPRWYGSDEDLVEFGHECASSQVWGGRVPLILADAHDMVCRSASEEERRQYFEKKEVWEDIKTAYEKFFELNPEATAWRHNYARHAFLCGQYEAFLEQTRLFTGGTNYAYFGGEPRFNSMIERAQAKSIPGGKSSALVPPADPINQTGAASQN